MTEYDYDQLDLPPGRYSKNARASESLFSEFAEPLLRTAAVWLPRGDTDLGHGCWEPIDPSEGPGALQWINRELLTFGFLRELLHRDFAAGEVVYPDFNNIHDTFRAILGRRARLAIVDGVPAISALEITPRTLLTSATVLNLSVFGGDPVDRLREVLCSVACETRGHSHEEIDALLRWADEEFVTNAIEVLQTDARGDVYHRYPASNSADNVNALVSVVLGFCSWEWSVDGPIFTQVRVRRKKSAKQCIQELRRLSSRNCTVRKRSELSVLGPDSLLAV